MHKVTLAYTHHAQYHHQSSFNPVVLYVNLLNISNQSNKCHKNFYVDQFDCKHALYERKATL